MSSLAIHFMGGRANCDPVEQEIVIYTGTGPAERGHLALIAFPVEKSPQLGVVFFCRFR